MKTLLLLIFCSTLLSAQKISPIEPQSTSFSVALVSLDMLMLGDVISTHQVLQNPRGAEANPLFRNMNSGQMLAIKSLVILATNWGLRYIYEENPTLAWVLTSFEIGLYAYVVSHNVQLTFSLRN